MPHIWQQDAACRGHSDLFYNGTEKAARALCAACPVAWECLDAALDGGEIGIWGGTNDTERVAIRLEVQRATSWPDDTPKPSAIPAHQTTTREAC